MLFLYIHFKKTVYNEFILNKYGNNMKNTITASRALVTLKHLDTSLDTEIAQAQFTYVRKNGAEISSGLSSKVIEEKVNGNYQSIRDKINNVFELRSGLNKVNHETMIKFGKKEMSILDALVYSHRVIPKLKQLVKSMQHDLMVKTAAYQKADASFEQALVSSKDNADMLSVLEKSFKPYLFPISDRIAEIQKEIEFFESEFDILLTELNPTLKFEF